MAVTRQEQSRLGLATMPTPLQEAPRLAEALGLSDRLWVKRDDLTGFAFGGNKVRQLELLVGAAHDAGCDTLVTAGAPTSNFVATAAAAAAVAGLRNVVVLAGEPVPASFHPNLAAALTWGAQPRWTHDADRSSVDRAQPEVADSLVAAGATPYVVPRGGATAVGSQGYRLAVDEVLAQLPDGVTPTVVVAVGSGGTLAGIVAGLVAHGRPLPVVGVSVSRPPVEVAAEVLRLARGVAEHMGEPPAEESDVRIVDGRGPGHGVPSQDGRRAAHLALVTEGLVLDPVYSAKALGALTGQVGTGPALLWHTGGLLDSVAGLLQDETPEGT